MLIAQITDIHIGFDKSNLDEHNMVRLRAVLDHLINGPNRPDLMLLSGDLTEDGARGIMPAGRGGSISVRSGDAGNHDLRGPLLDAFPIPPAPRWLDHMCSIMVPSLVRARYAEPGRQEVGSAKSGPWA